MKITKDHIGQTVWLMPYGNEVSRVKGDGGAVDQACSAVVEDMARTRGTIRIGTRIKDFRLRPEVEGNIETAFNGGYTVFASEMQFRDHVKAMQVRRRVSSCGSLSISDYAWLEIGKILESEGIDV